MTTTSVNIIRDILIQVLKVTTEGLTLKLDPDLPQEPNQTRHDCNVCLHCCPLDESLITAAKKISNESNNPTGSIRNLIITIHTPDAEDRQAHPGLEERVVVTYWN